MEKIKLTKVQAEAIENLKKTYLDYGTMIERVALGEFKDKRLYSLQLDGVIRALYIGYDVELTPEERVLKMYEQFKEVDCKTLEEVKWVMGFRTGIKRTLQELGVEIEGMS